MVGVVLDESLAPPPLVLAYVSPSMRVPGLAWAALAVGVVGLVMVFSLPPDPGPYIGAALMVLAPLLAIAAFVRSRRTVTAVAMALAVIPLGLLILALYVVATDTS
jgi:hypothetical protein